MLKKVFLTTALIGLSSAVFAANSKVNASTTSVVEHDSSVMYVEVQAVNVDTPAKIDGDIILNPNQPSAAYNWVTPEGIGSYDKFDTLFVYYYLQGSNIPVYCGTINGYDIKPEGAFIQRTVEIFQCNADGFNAMITPTPPTKK